MPRKLRELIGNKLLAIALPGIVLTAVLITGCISGPGPEDDDVAPGIPVATQVAPEREGEDSSSGHVGGPEGGQSGKEGTGEHRPGGEHGEGDSEHGSDGEGSGEVGRESREAGMSSPIVPLDQSWNGTLGGLAISMQHDAATKSVRGTVRNTHSEKLCYVQAEPHIKSGNRTVGELGPEKLGDLDPGQETTSSLAVAGEPKLAGVFYDGYVVHMEVFDCSGPGPSPHSEGEGSEGSGEHDRGEEGGREGRGEHGGGSESRGAGGEEGDGANALAPGESLDTTLRGARLKLEYDAASNSFKGTVENTTSGVLERVRVEVHLSNGTELGPTTPTDLAPGERLTIDLRATGEPFTGWTAHAEAGGGEGRESGEEHREGGEHGGERGEGSGHGDGG